MIEHDGVIEKINGNNITVRILQKSACSDCHAKGVCMSADSKSKEVDIEDSSGRFKENERVIVVGKTSQGYKSILWAFIIPMIILVTTLPICLTAFNLSDTKATIISIVALIPYYLILFLLRDKMSKSLKFSIKKAN